MSLFLQTTVTVESLIAEPLIRYGDSRQYDVPKRITTTESNVDENKGNFIFKPPNSV